MAVQTETTEYRGAEFVTFKNERGELFFFRKSTLMRGKPLGPYNTLEEVRRPATLLTLENIFSMTGVTVSQLRYAIHHAQLKAIKKTWWLGKIRRSGFLVHSADLQEFLTRKAVTKFHDKLIDWDIDAKDILPG